MGNLERESFLGGVFSERSIVSSGEIFPCPDIEESRDKLKEALNNFRQRHNLRAIVGLLGGADELGNAQRQIVTEFLEEMADFKIGILSGGTKGGLPQIAVEEAKFRRLPTIGIYPQKRKNLVLFDKLDLAIETPPPLVGEADFGTETPTLTSIPEAVVILGGSLGTLVEVSTILKRNKSLLKKFIAPVYVVPIHGTGGVADCISVIPGIEEVKSSLPPDFIHSGKEAAIFLKKMLVKPRN